jgi:hypothetical protein
MECLVAIKFNLFNYNDNTEIQTEPKVFGPVDSYHSENIIDEIILTLAQDEEIYLIKGEYNNQRIEKMSIYTTFGQFLEFGQHVTSKPGSVPFSWEFHFNLRSFDGFIIGWNDKSLTYLASLVIEVLRL